MFTFKREGEKDPGGDDERKSGKKKEGKQDFFDLIGILNS